MRDPRYKEIASDLRAKIEGGALKRGAQLPTEKQLMAQYSASRNTVRDAVRFVVNLGLVQTHAGRGSFVTRKIDPFVTTLGSGSGVGGDTRQYRSDVARGEHKAVTSDPRIEVQEARVAPELKLDPTESVVSRHQERFLDDQPSSLQTTFYPMQLVEDGAGKLLSPVNIEPGAVSYLTEVLGVKEIGWQDKVIVRAPDKEEAKFFDLADDGRVAIVEIRRTAFVEGGEVRPLRLTVTTCPADRNQFLIRRGQVPDDA
jgi:GntR family transcriptional regulator